MQRRGEGEKAGTFLKSLLIQLLSDWGNRNARCSVLFAKVVVIDKRHIFTIQQR